MTQSSNKSLRPSKPNFGLPTVGAERDMDHTGEKESLSQMYLKSGLTLWKIGLIVDHKKMERATCWLIECKILRDKSLLKSLASTSAWQRVLLAWASYLHQVRKEPLDMTVAIWLILTQPRDQSITTSSKMLISKPSQINTWRMKTTLTSKMTKN